MYDALLVLQASVTKTDTFNGTGVNLPSGTPTWGLVARIVYSAATLATSTGGFTFSLDKSADNSTFYIAESGAADAIVLTTTAQAKEIFIPFRHDAAFPYVRLTVTKDGSPGTPTVTYFADIGLAKP